MKKEMKKIAKEHFEKLPKEIIEDILPIMAIDLFFANKRIKRLVIWNWVLAGLLVLDLIAFWGTKLIK